MTDKISVNSATKLSEAITDLLSYSPETGEFTWKVARGRCSAGSTAGYDTGRGYIGIRINKRCTYAHRIAFLLMTGSEPKAQVDHINGDRSDNRWVNLREVTCAENMMNRQVSGRNKSGVMGVFWNTGKGKWTAKIKKNQKTTHLGYFDDLAMAAAARKEAEVSMGFHQNHGRASHG